ncbi:MAG: hypothetical protein ABL974_11005 [Prosthecobacter sp.]
MIWYADASFLASAFGEDANTVEAKVWLRACRWFVGCECVLDAESAITFNGFRKLNVVFPQIIGPSAVRALDHSRVAEPEGLFLSRCGYCNLDR